MISSGHASLLELREHYYLEDVYTMLEIASVDIHNRKVANAEAQKRAK